MQLNPSDFPALFQKTDQFSINAQQAYLKWVRLELFILILAAILSVFPIFNNPDYRLGAILVAVSLIVGIALTFYIKHSKFEDDWYMGRAIAESVKSLTWKYITRGAPFGKSGQSDIVDRQFIALLKNINDQYKSFLKVSCLSDGDVFISPQMKKIRESELEKRKQVYVENRITDQLKWYEKKSLFNKAQTNKLHWLIIIMQAIALIYAIYLIFNPAAFNIVPIVTTIAAAFISWLQIKRHQELSKSYEVAAHEIQKILQQSVYINTEIKFEQYVDNSENAFSREHTLWIARRDLGISS